MPKYRRLSEQELSTFEKEFIEFLIINGITAEDWEHLKKDEFENADKMIDIFSDVILEGILRKINFLEIRNKNYLAAIQCLQDKMILVGISAVNMDVDLSKVGEGLTEIPEGISIHKSEKKYEEIREAELFELTKKGYDISDGTLFKQLMLASIQ